MRKDVKRARLWLINNLNQRVKKLSVKKGNEKELDKNKRKVEKLRSEIQLLKHIDLDEVSKFALCNKQEMLPQANQNELNMAQHVMVRLANHKFIQDQVQKFRQTYTVPMDRLILLIRSLGLQYQKKKRKLLLDGQVDEVVEPEKVAGVATRLKKEDFVKKQKARQPTASKPTVEPKENSVTDPTKTESDEVISSSIAAIKDDLNESSTVEVERADILLQSSKEARINKKISESTENRTCDRMTSSASSNSVTKTVKCKENTRQKIPWPKMSIPPIDKKIGSMEIKQLNLDKMEADTISLEKSNKISDNKSEINELPRDSFFLGGVDLPSDGDGDDLKNNPGYSEHR